MAKPPPPKPAKASPRAPGAHAVKANANLTRQTRKLLGKHYANKYRTGGRGK